MTTGLSELEQMVKDGRSLNEVTITRLERSVVAYHKRAQEAMQQANDREARVRALKAASKDNE